MNNEFTSRYHTFKICIDFLHPNLTDKKVLELGTTRSFVDGKYDGCNSNDVKYWNKDDCSKWDWGAGCVTLIFGQLPGIKLTTVDTQISHINRCRYMTDSLNIKCGHVLADSVNFLKTTQDKYDLIYLDTGDMTPIEPTSQQQLSEVQIIHEYNILAPSGLLLIDDVLNKTPKEYGENSGWGKSKYSIPYLLDSGYEILYKGYQYILFLP